VLEAFLWGLFSASSLLVGAWIAIRVSFPDRVVGLVMAFAAGVLIAAVAYELVEEAVTEHSAEGVALGLFAGSLVFFAGDWWLDRRGAEGRKASKKAVMHAGATAIILGIVLDGIPESAVLGLSLIEETVSTTMVVAVFISNLPEALAATSGMRKGGWPTRNIWRLWAAVTAVSALSAALGFGLFDTSGDAVIAFVMAFAAGAILTMLADTMMPEAFESAGPYVGLLTTFGFAVAFAIQGVE
jgi:ZIP family zinc transporter